MSARRRLLAALASIGLLASTGLAGEIPGALVILESLTHPLPGYVAEAAPPRFVLMEDGQVFVGGTSEVATGRLEGGALKSLDKRLSEVRKLSGLAGSVSLGSGAARHRLFLRKGRPIDMVVSGEPTQATGSLRALGSLISDLARFDHPSLRPYKATQFALSAREGKQAGGCRSWPFSEPLSSATFVPRVLTAGEVASWPVGAAGASVCAGDKSYVVTLRPLLPGEKP
jgi:hypothetical protein